MTMEEQIGPAEVAAIDQVGAWLVTYTYESAEECERPLSLADQIGSLGISALALVQTAMDNPKWGRALLKATGLALPAKASPERRASLAEASREIMNCLSVEVLL